MIGLGNKEIQKITEKGRVYADSLSTTKLRTIMSDIYGEDLKSEGASSKVVKGFIETLPRDKLIKMVMDYIKYADNTTHID